MLPTDNGYFNLVHAALAERTDRPAPPEPELEPEDEPDPDPEEVKP